MLACRRDEPVGLGDRVRDRLLDQHAGAGAEAVDRHRDVLVVRSADMHDIGAHRLEQLAVVGERRHAVPFGRRRGAGRVGVADPDEIGAGEVPDRLQVHD